MLRFSFVKGAFGSATFQVGVCNDNGTYSWEGVHILMHRWRCNAFVVATNNNTFTCWYMRWNNWITNIKRIIWQLSNHSLKWKIILLLTYVATHLINKIACKIRQFSQVQSSHDVAEITRSPSTELSFGVSATRPPRSPGQVPWNIHPGLWLEEDNHHQCIVTGGG